MSGARRPIVGTPEWAALVTASKVPAILGISPWESQRSLYHHMRGDVPLMGGTVTTRRGHYLEPAILAWWGDQHPEYTTVTRDVWCSMVPWGGATLDGLAFTDDGQWVIVEAKSAARRDEWGQPGTDEIPVHYLAQVQWQLAMTPDAARAHVAVLFGPGLEFAEYVVERDPATEAALLRICETWHASLAQEIPPPLDDSVATLDTMRRLHPDIDGQDMPLDPETATTYVTACNHARDAEAAARLAKSTLLDLMGTARTVSLDGTTIARRQPGRGDAISLIQVAKTIGVTTDAA